MKDGSDPNLLRYERQMAFAGVSVAGQRRLADAKVLIVGVGGLGSWTADLLARAGVGFMRIADDDRVEMVNLHRQALYSEADAAGGEPKARAARRRLRAINAEVAVEPVVARLDAGNVADLAAGVDLILDGTDNFATRFVLNDYAVRESVPWVFAGVVGAAGQVMPVVPGRTACLRCVFDAPPPPCADPSCRAAGVLGPAVAAVSAIQAAEAIKILAGRLDDVSPYLLKIDLWKNDLQRIDAARAAKNADCPCCKGAVFDYLEV